MAATGNGATVGYGSSTVIGSVTSISGVGGTRESIDVSNLATTGGREFIPSDLVDYGELSIEGHWNGTAAPIGAAVETVTITIGTTAGSKAWVGSAFCTSWETTAPMDDIVGYSMSLKCTGAWTLSST